MKSSSLLILSAVLLASCDRAQVPAVQDAADDHPFIEHVLGYPDLEWRTVTTEHLIVHGVANSYSGTNLSSFAHAAEEARHLVLSRLEEDDASSVQKPHVFLVRSREDLQELVGQPAGGWTEPTANAVLAAVSEDAPPALRHELGHLYSHSLWGRPHSTWLSEGVAVFAVGHCAGIPLHHWAAEIQRSDESTSLQVMEREFDFSRAAPHLLAGSFVTFLADHYGMEIVKTAWQHGLGPAAGAIGVSAEALESEWESLLRGIDDLESLPDFRGRVRCENGAG